MPAGLFARLPAALIASERERVLWEVGGIIMPAPPDDTPLERARYELAALRERILQVSLHQTADLLTAVESLGFTSSANLRRGQWVQFVCYALHVSARAGVDVIPGPDGAHLEGGLIEDVLRRLAHELPEVYAVPQDVPATLSQLITDYTQASEAYSSLPVRWVDDHTPAAPWLLARHSVERLTQGDATAMQDLPSLVIRLSEELVDGIGAEASWRRIEAIVRGATPA